MLLMRQLLLMACFWVVFSVTAQVNQPQQQASASPKNNTEQPEQYSVDLRIIVMLDKSWRNSEQISADLQQYLLQTQLAGKSLNPAEQYLVYLIRANIAKTNNIAKAIEWLEKAKQLQTKIATHQLNDPRYYAVEKLLAELYAKQGQYKLAFDNKKAYFRRYLDFHQAQKQKTVERLNKKYRMDLKRKRNELLQQQNAAEAEKIQNSELAQQYRQRNLLFLAFIVIVFMLLLIRQIKIKAQITRIAERDSLTQLYNRKILFERGEKLFKFAKRKQAALSVVVFDIDHFKQINDQFGHLTGDEVLTQLANLSIETMRSRDVIARLGGEEFVALMPGLNGEQAKASAERLREKFAQFNFTDKNIEVTASFGVAQLNNNIDNLDQLIQYADLAMYQAKQAGRNKVICYQTSFEAAATRRNAARAEPQNR